MTNDQVSLQCPTAEYPCSVQPPKILAVPKCRVSLQCRTADYPCSAQLQSIPAVPKRRVSLQCPTAEYPYTAQPQSIPTAKYPGSAQLQSIPAVSNHQECLQGPTEKYPCSAPRVSLECPTAEYQYSCSAFAVLQERQLRGAGKRYTSCNNGFRVVMLFFLFFLRAGVLQAQLLEPKPQTLPPALAP